MLAERKSLEIWKFGESRPIKSQNEVLVGRSSKALSRGGTSGAGSDEERANRRCRPRYLVPGAAREPSAAGVVKTR